MVDLPRAGAFAVIVPGHPGLELLLDVRLEGLDRATEVVERAPILVRFECVSNAARDDVAEVAHWVTLAALVALSVVPTDATPTAVLTPVAQTVVLADAGPAAVSAVVALTTVFADAAPPTVLSHAAQTVVLTSANPTTVLAHAVLAIMFT